MTAQSDDQSVVFDTEPINSQSSICPQLVGALRAAAIRYHRICIAVTMPRVARAGVSEEDSSREEAEVRHQLIDRVASLLIASRRKAGLDVEDAVAARVAAAPLAKIRILACTRHSMPCWESTNFIGMQGDGGVEVSSWAFGQTRKHNCLGQTFDACVVFDTEELMPETLWAAAETVRGGGVVVVQLLGTSAVDATTYLDMSPGQMQGAIGAQLVARQSRHALGPRLDRVLREAAAAAAAPAASDTDAAVIMTDSTLRLDGSTLPALVPKQAPAGVAETSEEQGEVQASSETETALLALACTCDQRRTILKALRALRYDTSNDGSAKSISTAPVVIVGRRGRGKSTVVGLVAAGAICHHGPGMQTTGSCSSSSSAEAGAREKAKYSALVITAPALENVGVLLESMERGCDALSREGEDGSCAWKLMSVRGSAGCKHGSANSMSYLMRCSSKAMETDCILPVHAVAPEQAELVAQGLQAAGHSVLLVVDEAASLPVPLVRGLLSAPVAGILLAGTVSGCEGTGGALAWKVFGGALGHDCTSSATHKSAGSSHPKRVSPLESPVVLSLDEPVRYRRGCPVEELLDRLLFLGTAADLPLAPLDVAAVGKAADAKLYQLNTSALEAAEHGGFAKALIALLQTHYRTSASDIANMLAQPYMYAFALLPNDDVFQVPVVALLCIIERPSESGPLTRPQEGANRVSRSHLTTFAFEQDYPETCLGRSVGLRVTRVVCDPRLRGRGFGSAAIEQLAQWLAEPAKAVEMQGGTTPEVKTGTVPRAADLLVKSSAHALPSAEWLSASFGATQQLLRFWAHLRFIPAVLSPERNPQTGELSVVMIRPVHAGTSLHVALCSVGPQFALRFLRTLPHVDAALPVASCVDILLAATSAGSLLADARQKGAGADGARPLWWPARCDSARLERLAISRDPLPVLAHAGDFLPELAQAYFTGKLHPLRLPRADAELLLAAARAAPRSAATAASVAAEELGIASANLAALGLRRIVGEVARRVGLSLCKEVLFVLRPNVATSDVRQSEFEPPSPKEGDASGSWWAWLPSLSDVYRMQQETASHEFAALKLPLFHTRGEGKAQETNSDYTSDPCLDIHASWRYPIEQEAGDLVLEAPRVEYNSGGRQLETETLTWLCEARVLHKWQVLPLPLGEAGCDPLDVTVSLVGSPPCAADVEIILCFREAFVGDADSESTSTSVFSRCLGFARLPSLESVPEPGLSLTLPMLSPPTAAPQHKTRLGQVSLNAAWRFPCDLARGRGKGLLSISNAVVSPTSPLPVLAAEVVVFHLVDKDFAVPVVPSGTQMQGGAHADDAGTNVKQHMRLKLRPKQNRPKGKCAKLA